MAIMKKTKSGFTIVELLIVIVVIAVLAAITFVVWQSMDTRAKNTAIISTASSWVKALESYSAANGSLKFTSAETASMSPAMITFMCLGSEDQSYEAIPSADLTANQCISGVPVYRSSLFSDKVRDAGFNVHGSTPVLTAGGGTVVFRGMILSAHTEPPAQLLYYLIGSTDCGISQVEGTPVQRGGQSFTLCSVELSGFTVEGV
jgi:prepilin-type N-terminal cleavage/methylation domain-containing protein